MLNQRRPTSSPEAGKPPAARLSSTRPSSGKTASSHSRPPGALRHRRHHPLQPPSANTSPHCNSARCRSHTSAAVVRALQLAPAPPCINQRCAKHSSAARAEGLIADRPFSSQPHARWTRRAAFHPPAHSLPLLLPSHSQTDQSPARASAAETHHNPQLAPRRALLSVSSGSRSRGKAADADPADGTSSPTSSAAQPQSWLLQASLSIWSTGSNGIFARA